MFHSVIIPTHKPLHQIERTFQSLANLPSRDFETIVVQNGTPDEGKSAAAAQLAARLPGLRIVHEQTTGLLAGRHRGLQESSADLLTFIDDDVEVSSTWMDAIRDGFRDEKVQMVGGPCVPEYEGRLPEWLPQFFESDGAKKWCYYLSLLDYGNEFCQINPRLIWGLNFSIRKSALINSGGFHPDYTPWHLRKYKGDGETAVADQVDAAGGVAVYHPNASVTHLIPRQRLTLDYFEKNAFLSGISSSYTQIRSTGQVPNDPPITRFASIAERIKIRLGPLLARRSHTETIERRRINLAFKNGIRFHQREVRNNPELLEWVLRDNYWDYSYPASN